MVLTEWRWKGTLRGSGSIEDQRLHRGRRMERLPPIYNEFEANLGSLKPCLKTNKSLLPLVRELAQRLWGPVPTLGMLTRELCNERDGLWLGKRNTKLIHTQRTEHRQPGPSCRHRRSVVFFWGFGFLPQVAPAQPPLPTRLSLFSARHSDFCLCHHLSPRVGSGTQ